MSQLLPAADYNTQVFDRDDAALVSKKVKAAAFYQAFLPYGVAAT